MIQYPTPLHPPAVPRNLLSHNQPLPHRIAAMERVLEDETCKDEEVVILLNHWSRRHIYEINLPSPAVAYTFTTPLFDFWYDHLIEEGMASGQVVSSAGGGMAFGGASGPAPGTSPQEAYRWQNHIFDYTLKVVTSIASLIPVVTVTIVCGMNLQATDEPVTTSTMTVSNDLTKSDQTVFLTGRVPMRFMRFNWSFLLSGSGSINMDTIQQISVRKT